MISIVLPVYNGEEFLKYSIDSIINQSYNNWELIIVNDCSIDRTKEIAEKYVNSDERIKLINNKTNMKLPNSLNIGFSNAKGDYLTWTSDDNIYMENALSRMVKELELNPDISLVYSDMYFINKDGKIEGKQSIDVSNIYLMNCIGACFMYRKKHAKIIGNYNPDFFLVEDYDYWIRLNKVGEVKRIPELLYYYRKHDGSLTAQRTRDVEKRLYNMRIEHLDFLLSKMDELSKEKLFLDMWNQENYLKEDVIIKFFKSGVVPQKFQWIYKKNEIDIKKEIVLFGAGSIGKKALKFFGKERIIFFSDNNEKLIGSNVDGIEVISFKTLIMIKNKVQVVVSVDGRKEMLIAKQLVENGISNYVLFSNVIR